MDRLAAAAERVASYSSRLKKIGILADYLRSLDDDDLVRASHFLSGSPFANSDDRRLSVGYATLREAVLAVSGYDEEILRICYREVGDGGETIGLLLRGHTREEPLPLALAESYYMNLVEARKTAEKVRILTECFGRHHPLAIKYFVKIITRDLRIGLQEKMLEEAIAAAAGVPHAAVRQANNRSGALGAVALAARRGDIHTVEARLFHPLDFMLAKPLDDPTGLENAAEYYVEDKYDGIRAQAHVANGRVAIYTRGLEDVTASFPDVVRALHGLHGSAVVDGEILAWRDGRALHFNVLQQRIARKRLSAEMLAEIPIVFMAYDLLFRDDLLLLDTPLEERRAALTGALEGQQFVLLSPMGALTGSADIAARFEEARARGNEGLVLKRRGSLYEPGRRSGAWYKVKRPYATLDVVITAAEQGHGRRATVLSDYTFAVRDGDRFLNVGKAYSGLTDAEIRELTKLLRSIAAQRYGRALLVRPEIVLEVAFDAVQKSARHKSGYALRFPRIARWRKDKRPEDVDTLDRVRELYDASIVKA